MTQPTNHWKLGLFVVVSFLLGLGALAYLGAKAFGRDALIYRSFFDESVTGLDIGSVVRFRGVTVGTVTGVTVAPDRRHVAVSYGLNTEATANIGIQGAGAPLPPQLRAQVSAQGLTGQKYILLDFFDVNVYPVPKLPFPEPERVIPAASSPLKNIEDSVVRAIDRFPELAEQLSQLLSTTNRLLTNLEEQQLPARADQTLAQVERTLETTQSMVETLRSKIAQVPVQELSSEAQTAMSQVSTTMIKLQSVLDRINADDGVLASTARASDSVGLAAQSAQDIGREVNATLREVREAAAALRQMLDALERDSDMLLKGRAEVSE